MVDKLVDVGESYENLFYCVYCLSCSFQSAWSFSPHMGQAQVTPNTFLLSHFSEACARGWNFGVDHLKEGKSATLCPAD